VVRLGVSVAVAVAALSAATGVRAADPDGDPEEDAAGQSPADVIESISEPVDESAPADETSDTKA